MIQHKSKLLQFAAYFASRRGGFIMALLGMLVQAWHTFYISSHLSLMEGWQKYVNAIFMAVFLSGALLYFTLKSSNANTDEAAKYRRMVIWFAVLESCINLWYWGYKLIYLADKPDWMSMIIAVPFAFLLPITLKAYGGEIRIDEPELEYTPQQVQSLKDVVLQWMQEEQLELMKRSSDSSDVDNTQIQLLLEKLEHLESQLVDVKNNTNINDNVFANPIDLTMSYKETDGRIKTLPIQLTKDRSKELENKLNKVM